MEIFGIKFVNISPPLFSSSKLGNIITKFEKAVLTENRSGKTAEEQGEEELIVALTEIDNNCIILKFATPETMYS